MNLGWTLNGDGWIGGGLGVREHSQCLVVNMEGCSYIQQKALTLTETSSKNNMAFPVCWRHTAPPKMTAITMGSYQVFGRN